MSEPLTGPGMTRRAPSVDRRRLAVCGVGALLLAALTAWLYVSYGAWALAWTWPVHLVLVLTEPLADIPLRWVCRVAVFAAFYLLLCWPWWKARAGIWSGFLWVAAQLAALTVAYQVLSAK